MIESVQWVKDNQSCLIQEIIWTDQFMFHHPWFACMKKGQLAKNKLGRLVRH